MLVVLFKIGRTDLRFQVRGDLASTQQQHFSGKAQRKYTSPHVKPVEQKELIRQWSDSMLSLGSKGKQSESPPMSPTNKKSFDW